MLERKSNLSDTYFQLSRKFKKKGLSGIVKNPTFIFNKINSSEEEYFKN